MHRRHPLVIASVVVTAGFTLLAAGCGGSRSPGLASLATSATASTTTTQSGLLAFSQCMRANGLPNFPDPQHFAGGNVKLTIRDASPSRAAMSACAHLLPTDGGTSTQQTAEQQRTRRADGLSFARCMRSHGVSRFPDPTVQGELTVAMVQAQGIDVHDPAVLRVVQTCLPASHGALTPAKVRAAINEAGG